VKRAIFERTSLCAAAINHIRRLKYRSSLIVTDGRDFFQESLPNELRAFFPLSWPFCIIIFDCLVKWKRARPRPVAS
jgi:hypothetical protein